MPTIANIQETARQIKAGTLRPRDVVETCLERIERFEDSVHAWVLVDADGARETADRLGEEAADGNVRGPLHGIPVGIKDIVDVEGWPTRAGSSVTSAGPATRDATLVQRLRAAGAILLGKTVTTEFACFDPAPTRNPWHLNHTPGGSSSGSAAAVTLGMCLGAIGSQTGGSITRPASYCGISGLKPTLGRVSVDGVVPVSFHLDHPGPMARSVADLAIMLEVIAGPDPRDPFCAREPAGGFVDATESSVPPRLGLFETFFMTESDEQVNRVTRDALDVLRRGGADVATVELPDGFGDVHRMHRAIMAVDAADFHRTQYPGRQKEYGPNLAAMLDQGQGISALDYSAALRHQRCFQHELLETFGDCDVLITPSTPTTAPASLNTTGDPKFNSPFSYAGLPTVSLPCGLTADGMPSSLQLVGRPFTEGPLLSAAAWCERELAFKSVPPMLAAPEPDR